MSSMSRILFLLCSHHSVIWSVYRILWGGAVGGNLRKIFTLTVDSACWSPLVATHLYVPALSVPALYSVRVEDDSSLRVTVVSCLFGSILSPLGPNQSMCLATPTTKTTDRTEQYIRKRYL